MTEKHKEKYDEMLFEVLKECKTLPVFFDIIFGFLQRRTDFYHIAEDPNAAVGLPQGLAEQLLKHSFFKWKPIPEHVYSDSDIPTAIIEEVITSDCENIENIATKTNKLNLKDQDSLLPPNVEGNCNDYIFSESESYNGSIFENYCWSQTITDFDIIVKVPENIPKKGINVEILPTSIFVKLTDDVCLIKGDFCHKCKANDAIWSVSGGKLEIHLDKCQERWWDCLITTEPQLDLLKIDCSRPYEDLPEEEQVKIQELKWNQERKRMGLPTSEEISLQETLQKAWNVEGSPFNGPYDPDAVSLG